MQSQPLITRPVANRLVQKNLVALACSLALLACGQKSEAPRGAMSTEAAAAAPAPEPAALQMAKSQMSSRSAQSAVSSDSAAEKRAPIAGDIPAAAIAGLPAQSAVGTKNRQLVLTANARFKVKNTYAASLAIEDAVVASDGFVVSNTIESAVTKQAEVRGDDGELVRIEEFVVNGTLTVRVPSHKTSAFLREIAGLVEVLDQRSIAARDVQFEMLRSQLEAARNNEAQADLGQLANEPGRVADKGMVIEARNNAKAARDEARIAQAQLVDQVGFSTLTLSLYQSPQGRTSRTGDFARLIRENQPGFLTQLGRGVSDGWRGLKSAAISAVTVWPLWLLIAGVIGAALGYRSRRRRKLAAV